MPQPQQVPPVEQVTHYQFKLDVVVEPNPEGGEPIRNLVIVHPRTGKVELYPMAPEAAERIGKKLRDKQIATPTEGEASAILGANGQPAGE